MNLWDLDATGLMVWGLVVHLVADWMLQSDWMATNKARRRPRKPLPEPLGLSEVPRAEYAWYDRHPAAYVHAGIHGVLLALVFGWVALPLALVHLVIDTRTPVVWWSRLIRQTQPWMRKAVEAWAADPECRPYSMDFDDLGSDVVRMKVKTREPTSAERLDMLMRDMREWTCPVLDLGTVVRLWVDQVFHVATIAVAALVVGALG